MRTLQRVAIYTRISDDSEGEGEGVARQLEDCEARAKREGWKVKRIFPENDTGASRHSVKKRPLFVEMMAAAERGEFDVILSYSNSRLTRRPRELEDFVDLNARKGVRFCTVVSGDADLSTDDGLMIARILASVDANESDRISSRVRRQVVEKVGKGHWLGGVRPFGWGYTVEETLSDGKVRRTHHDIDKLNVKEANMVRGAIQYLIAGGTYEIDDNGERVTREGDEDELEKATVGQVLRVWAASGVTTTRGTTAWRYVGINKLLCRWRNAGITEHRGEILPDVVTTWEPICSREELDNVRAVLLDPDRKNGHGFAPRHLLAGIAICGKDGHTLNSGAVIGRGKKKYLLYRCTGPGCGLAIQREQLDAAVVRHVLREYRRGPSNRFEGARTEVREAMAETHRELVGVLAERREVEEAINERLTSIAAMRPTLTRLAGQEAELRGEIERHYREDAHAAMLASVARVWHPTGDAPAYPEVADEAGEVVSFAELDAIPGDGKRGVSIAEASVGMTERWEALLLPQRRKLIKALFTITVQPGRGDDRVQIADAA